VSRNTLRRRIRINELTDELSIGAALRLRCESDDIHHVVAAVVAYLVEEYPAQDLYIPASLRAESYPVEAIRQAVTAKESVRAVCKRFRIDRRTLYRLLDEAPANDEAGVRAGP
jgi:transcriptional regulator with PAS, ATPase and Fis domain